MAQSGDTGQSGDMEQSGDMAPSGELGPRRPLQALLRDGTLAGSWTLDAARSTVQLKTRHTWGLAHAAGGLPPGSPATAR